MPISVQTRWRSLIDHDGSVDYVSELMRKDDADNAFRLALSNIQWRQERIVVYGKQLDVPRLSAWFSDVGHTYTYSGIVHEPQSIPPFMQLIKQCIEETTQFHFNSVLANLYEHGSHSVGWHADNEPELGPSVNIASFSLGSTRRLKLRHRHLRNRNVSIDLEHNSLLMMYEPLQRHWLHELPKTRRHVGPRVNFSFRLMQ